MLIFPILNYIWIVIINWVFDVLIALIIWIMRNKYNSNDSLFSLEYKIPYEKSSIE